MFADAALPLAPSAGAAAVASSPLAAWQAAFRERVAGNIGSVPGVAAQEAPPASYSEYEDGDEDLPPSTFSSANVIVRKQQQQQASAGNSDSDDSDDDDDDSDDGLFEWTAEGQQNNAAAQALAWFEARQSDSSRPLASEASECSVHLPLAACKWLDTVREVYTRERSGRTRRLMTGADPDFGTCQKTADDDADGESELVARVFPRELLLHAAAADADAEPEDQEGRALQDDTCYEVVQSDYLPRGNLGTPTGHTMFHSISWGDCASMCAVDRNCLAFGFTDGGVCYVFSADLSRYENMCSSIKPSPSPDPQPVVSLVHDSALINDPRLGPGPDRLKPAPQSKGPKTPRDAVINPAPGDRQRRRKTPAPVDRPVSRRRSLYVLPQNAEYDCDVVPGETTINTFAGVVFPGIDIFQHICETPAPQVELPTGGGGSTVSDREYIAVDNHYCSQRDSFVVGQPATSAAACQAQCLAFEDGCDTYSWISDRDHEDYGRCVLFWGCSRLTYNKVSEFQSYVWCDSPYATKMGVYCHAPSPSIGWYAEADYSRVKTYTLVATGETSDTHVECAQQCEGYTPKCDAFQWTSDTSVAGCVADLFIFLFKQVSLLLLLVLLLLFLLLLLLLLLWLLLLSFWFSRA